MVSSNKSIIPLNPFSLSQEVSGAPAVDGNCDGLISAQPTYVPVDDRVTSMSSPQFFPYVDMIPNTQPEYIFDDNWLIPNPTPAYIPGDDWLRSSSPRVPVDNYGDRISQPPSVPVDDWMPPPPTTDAYYGGDYLMPPFEGVSSYDPALSLVPFDGCCDFQIPPPPAAAYFGGGGDQPPQPLEGVPYLMQSIGEPSPIAAVESGGGDEESWKWSLPPGIRFRPMDEELIVHYLMPEFLNGYSDSRGIIKCADIYDYEPQQLKALAYDHQDGKMYFYTRITKIGNKKTERIIKSKKGYWKTTQAKKPIRGKSGNIVGSKTPLVYFIYNDDKEKEKNKDIKTPWHMSEYRLEYRYPQPSSLELVLAVIYYY